MSVGNRIDSSGSTALGHLLHDVDIAKHLRGLDISDNPLVLVTAIATALEVRVWSPLFSQLHAIVADQHCS
jgi:hypothetical protein